MLRGGTDQARLMARVARMHHELGMRQGEIAAELRVSTAKVSRLLKRAAEEGIVRTVVIPPSGVYTEIEWALEEQYGLDEVVVVDVTGTDDALLPALGAAAAVYLETTLTGEPVVGISSWSSSLLATMNAMRPTNGYRLAEVVQMVGGHGTPDVQLQSSRLIARFSQLTGAVATMVPAPGLLGSASAARSLLDDPAVRAVTRRWSDITVALVGIGGIRPSPLIRESGNSLSAEDLEALERLGAVGDVCLRYFDARGCPMESEIDSRVVAISPRELLAIQRRIAVAGGIRKLEGIRSALRGGWVTVLVTDIAVARALLEPPETARTPRVNEN